MENKNLVDRFRDINDPLFGGSLAYAQVELNLALLIKLLKLKAKNNPDRQSTYQKISQIADALAQQAHIMIEKDAEIFDVIRKAETKAEKSKIVAAIFPSSFAFIENLLTITSFLAALIDETTSSLKYDFIMMRDTLLASKTNLVHILEYELRKMEDGVQKEEYFGMLSQVER